MARKPSLCLIACLTILALLYLSYSNPFYSARADAAECFMSVDSSDNPVNAEAMAEILLPCHAQTSEYCFSQPNRLLVDLCLRKMAGAFEEIARDIGVSENISTEFEGLQSECREIEARGTRAHGQCLLLTSFVLVSQAKYLQRVK